MEGMRTSLRNAKIWGADTVLLVPAVVNPETTLCAGVGAQPAADPQTDSARRRSSRSSSASKRCGTSFCSARWNSRATSTSSSRRGSAPTSISATSRSRPIRRIGSARSASASSKLHVKDFSFKKREAEFTPLLEGEIDWRAVHAALADIGYQGTATVELSGGDAAYLKEVNARFEKILAGTV